jgi:hypothetical protein
VLLRKTKPPGPFAWTLVGGAVGLGRFTTVFCVIFAVQPPAVAYALAIPGLITNVVFGLMSGYVSYHVLRAVLGTDPQESPPNATPEESQINAAPEESQITAAPEESPPNATPEESQINATPEESPITATPEESPITAAPEESPITTTPEEAPSNE